MRRRGARDGIETVSASQSHARFDFNGDGLADDTSWIGTGEGFLYLDRDANGTVSGVNEITFIDDLPNAASREGVRIGERIRDGNDEQLRFGRGYDHNWVVSRQPAERVQLLARVEDPASGRVLEVFSNQPGVPFYTGNFLDGTVTGKSGAMYRQGDALCLEPQVFPDTPNKPEFGSARLDPGGTYREVIVYRFSVRE